MNEVFLIYLWGLWDGFGELAVMTIIMLFVITLGSMLVYVEAGSEELENSAIKYAKRSAIALFTLILLYTLTPSKHIAVMMYSAPTIVQVAKDMKDSNTTKSISNILDNSLKYLEKKSKELAKE